MWQNSFNDELTKLAGVGWDLHGYHRDPDAPKPSPEQIKAEDTYDKDWRKWQDKKHKAIGKPPFYNVKDRKKYFKKAITWEKANPFVSSGKEAVDPWYYKRDSRIKTPFDRKTNYKLNSTLDVETGGNLHQYTSDFAYSDKDVDRRLTRDELKKVVEIYKGKAPKYLSLEPKKHADIYNPQAQAFIQKAEHLLKDPKMQFARLEYE
jgi:hypothetical protein